MLKVSFYPGRFHELPGGNQRQAIDVARMADDAGLYSLQLGDHLVVGNRVDRYPYGTYRHEVDCPWLEPIAAMSAFAAVTSNIRLSMGVLLAPLRPAVLLAKQLATLDVLSDGRCEPGIGTGWQREEYWAEGLDWTARRRIFVDTIAACRALWGEQPVSFKSPTISFEGLYALPRPIQKRIPILYGVRLTDENVSMITELGDGWTPVAGREEVKDGIDVLRRSFKEAGRGPSELIIRGGLPLVWDDHDRIDLERTFERAPEALDDGITVLTIGFPVGYGSMFDSMSDVGRFIAEMGRIAAKY